MAAPKKATAKKAAPAKAVAAPKSEAKKEEAVSGDAGAADLQALADQSLNQGYFGITDDPNPNEAYSLKSGPDSPSAASHTPAAKAKKES